MSEYQRIAFRAIDGPVSDENLAFMRRQSSRAKITPWSFDNEYQFGDFRGDALKMLRRGYDLYLHYANFGVRTLLIRLPHGLPDPKAAEPYLDSDRLRYIPDEKGAGGVLAVEPYHEAGYLDELWDIEQLVERLIPLRGEILDGDLRPLYLAHLAVACDSEHDPDETVEAPVPAGLEKPTSAQRALAEFYGLSESLLAAAARGAPDQVGARNIQEQILAWLQLQPPATKDAWLAQWMAEANSMVRRDILAAFQSSQAGPAWPVVQLDRTITQLMSVAEEIANDCERKEAARAANKRAKRLAAMAADPDSTLRETEKLVEQRSLQSYEKVAALLTDLSDALAGSEQQNLAKEHAKSLRQKNPTLHKLAAALRRSGLLVK